MKKITYGTYRYVEYDATLQIRGKEVNVHFSGGSISAQGVTPATYTTGNPVVQRAIENMRSYKQGKIVKVREVEMDGMSGDARPSARHEAEPAAAGGAAYAASECKTKVEAACREDVAEYLKANYGYSSAQLVGRKLKEAVKERGIEIVGFEL